MSDVKRLISFNGHSIILPPNRKNLGVEAAYYKAMRPLLKEMWNDVDRELTKSYRDVEPTILSMDASPLSLLTKTLHKLTRRWTDAWNKKAPEISKNFVLSARSHSSRQFKRSLIDEGFSKTLIDKHFTVKFKSDDPILRTVKLSIFENVGLIKSIPQEFLGDVAEAVTKSAMAGRDLKSLQKHLTDKYDISERRAAFIARNQNDYVTSEVNRLDKIRLGLDESVWEHDGQPMKPRPRHLAFHGKKFSTEKGAPVGDDGGNYVHPGQEYGCTCSSRAIIPGF